MRKKIRPILIVVVTCLLGYMMFFTGGGPDVSAQFSSVRVGRGNIRQIVTATGEIRPMNTITIGSQVSGNIEQVFVDFNSKVTQGQVLITIDPQVLQATVNEALAALESSRAQLKFDRAEYRRAADLYKAGFIARSEMEAGRTRYQTSQQTVNRMQSQYDRAVVNLSFTTIVSPVNGTVIYRNAAVGQTLQAAFAAPALLEIAEDLTQMRIATSISEADIGMIRVGQAVTFTVDAFPLQVFNGTVNQIRLLPTMTQNVVVYTVIIGVDNSDMLLMPGMTAFVTVLVQEKENVWKAENSAFLVRSFRNILPENEEVIAGRATPANTLLILRSGKVILVPFRRGISTSTETEIIAEGLESGDRIITGRIGAQSGRPGGGAPQMPGPMGAMGGMGGRR